MALRVIGAGLPRTGTQSLKLALERLLGRSCYHMFELFQRLTDVPTWTDAALGRLPDWNELLAGYSATVDFPAAAYWPELMEVHPNAIVLLSVRDAESWWESWSQTVLVRVPELPVPVRDMIETTWSARLGTGLREEETAKRTFEDWNQKVRDNVNAARLLEWRLGDGWPPLCEALGSPRPRAPFPHVNSRKEFLEERVGPEDH